MPALFMPRAALVYGSECKISLLNLPPERGRSAGGRRLGEVGRNRRVDAEDVAVEEQDLASREVSDGDGYALMQTQE